MTPDILQYGAMGLLFAVLAAVSVFMKRFLERMLEENSEDRRFVRERVEKADEAMAGQLQAWIDAHKEQIMASTAIAETMAEMLLILRRLNGKGE